jgi:hypothetical protein
LARIPASLSTAATVDRRLVEKGPEPVILLLGQRVVLVVVAAAAVEGEPQPDRPGGLGHVHHVVDTILFRDAAALTVDRVVAQETGGEFLLEGRVRQ